MPLTLYYLEKSPLVRSVDLVIHALGLEAEHKEVNILEKEQHTPEFTKVNPLGTIPAIVEEDGFTLWECRTIMTYLVSKYGKDDDSLYPKDLRERAAVDQMLHFSNDVFCALKNITKPLLLFKIKGVPEEKMDKVKEMQESVEKLLVDKKFMAGDQLTLADFAFVTIMDILEVMTASQNKYPLTTAWFERCKTTIKDFDKVNAKGADQFLTLLREML